MANSSIRCFDLLNLVLWCEDGAPAATDFDPAVVIPDKRKPPVPGMTITGWLLEGRTWCSLYQLSCTYAQNDLGHKDRSRRHVGTWNLTIHAKNVVSHMCSGRKGGDTTRRNVHDCTCVYAGGEDSFTVAARVRDTHDTWG
jgi:hypothetical protein